MHALHVERLITALSEMQQIVKTLSRRLLRRSARDQEPEDDPVLAMLASLPIDDEPVTDEDRRRIVEGWQAYRDGQVVSAEEVRRGCLGNEGETPQKAKHPTAAV
jgi:hypothetical protein